MQIRNVQLGGICNCIEWMEMSDYKDPSIAPYKYVDHIELVL